MTSKFALVIANTEYQDASFAKLTAPGRDADEFAYVLRDPDIANFDDVQVLINEGESKARRAIARLFAEGKGEDLLLFYFSGHAVRNEQGKLFLAATDTEINFLAATGISAEFLLSEMNKSRSRRQVVILDGCNTGTFGPIGDETVSASAVGKSTGIAAASAVGRSIGIEAAFEKSGSGRIVLTASNSFHYALEGDKVFGDRQMSVFTYFLIKGLKGEADLDGDGRITVDELYDYTYDQVIRVTPKQTPSKFSYRQQGEIVLRDNLKPLDVKPLPLPPDLLELLSNPNPGVRRVGIQELTGLLGGKNLGLTRAAQEKLREIADHDDSLSLRETASIALSTKELSVLKSESKILPRPQPTKRTLKVFLCHSSDNKPVVRELYQQLIAEEWMDVWLDEMKLLPGQEFDVEIEKAVEAADIVIVCLSTNSVDKEGYVQKELRFVLNIAEEKPEGSIFVIPLRLDDCIVPRRLRVWHRVDYFPNDQRKVAYQRLLESLKLRAGKLGI